MKFFVILFQLVLPTHMASVMLSLLGNTNLSGTIPNLSPLRRLDRLSIYLYSKAICGMVQALETRIHSFKASGTYIFRPDGALQTVASRSVPLKIVRGPLVDLVHQQFNLWIYQRHNCGFSWRERQWEVDSDEPGEVLIDGINLKKLQFVSQELILFTTTIKENIAYGKAGATLEEIRTVTEIANARRFRDKMPHFTCLYFFFFFFVNSCYSQKDVVCGRLGKEDICSFLGKLIVLLILC
ncbi:uncharacterized protein LOC131246332 isoform X2 [Magnolia sinica]|uniref:uncharacterized protein LOC131246332 isoform X2 n=1 Tax=Magnolia sinica TaxID=86752 RepID=UPI002658A3EE|nr:uncharacterized protein LOC131246332 isoform X2 [Magnolia sinica]